MKRTTLFADEDTLYELKRIALQQRRPVSAVIREALAEYVVSHRPARRRFSFTAIGESGQTDLSGTGDNELAEVLEEKFEQQRESFEAYRRQQTGS